jgi:hypothetical protein
MLQNFNCIIVSYVQTYETRGYISVEIEMEIEIMLCLLTVLLLDKCFFVNIHICMTISVSQDLWEV